MKKDVFSGLGLGILIGTIIGLSIAETTGLILGALTSLLAAFFGLRLNKEGETGNQIIIGTFGVTCIISILIGIFLRTHNFLSPSIESEISMYEKASFDSSEIKNIILFKEFGILPKDYTFIENGKDLTRSTILMAGDAGGISLCQEIEDNSDLANILESYNNSGGKYASISNKLSEVLPDTSELKSTLLFFKNIICQD